MARNQTIFSELTVAQAIGDCELSKISNVDGDSSRKYEVEYLSRMERDPQSIKELTKAGKKVRNWLINVKRIQNPKISWTGMEIDLDHSPVARDLVILDTGVRISVKESAQLFQNPSPVKVFEKWPKGEFGGSRDGDWFITIASDELNDYYKACSGPSFTGQPNVEAYYENVRGTTLNGEKQRKRFTDHVTNLHSQRNPRAIHAYQDFCDTVSELSAETFNTNLAMKFPEIRTGVFKVRNFINLISFFFKLDENEYVLCGTEEDRCFAVLMHNLTQWEEKFLLTNIEASPLPAGQPEVLIKFSFKDKTTNRQFDYLIQCQVRWSHGKFCGNPESKLYRYNSWSYTNLAWAIQI